MARSRAICPVPDVARRARPGERSLFLWAAAPWEPEVILLAARPPAEPAGDRGARRGVRLLALWAPRATPACRGYPSTAAPDEANWAWGPGRGLARLCAPPGWPGRRERRRRPRRRLAGARRGRQGGRMTGRAAVAAPARSAIRGRAWARSLLGCHRRSWWWWARVLLAPSPGTCLPLTSAAGVWSPAVPERPDGAPKLAGCVHDVSVVSPVLSSWLPSSGRCVGAVVSVLSGAVVSVLGRHGRGSR